MPLRRRSDAPVLTLFFATDIHGSDLCFRKFLNAADFYGAQLLIMGGDMTGKLMVPITPQGAGWRAEYAGREVHLQTSAEVATFAQQLRDVGIYVCECDEDELPDRADQAAVEELMARVACESVRRWVELADERMAGKGVRILMGPANDDNLGVDDVIAASQTIVNPDGQCLDLDEGFQVITTGYSNITPWRTERELEEDKLEALMDGLFAQVRDPTQTIACLHVPPFGSGLDVAPRLDENFNVQYMAGDVDMIPVGSTAVRSVIQRHQPLVSLHGHIHESAGKKKIGRTTCINPGSEYTEGVLRGALVRLRHGAVISVQVVRG